MEYFKPFSKKPNFLEEIHHYLQEEYINEGTLVFEAGIPACQIIFVVQGIVDLELIDNEDYSKTLLDTLQQGDIISPFSIHSGDPILF